VGQLVRRLRSRPAGKGVEVSDPTRACTANPALLIIDVQQALCSGEHAAFEADVVIGRINQVARKARAAGATVVVIQHESDTGPLVHGSAGWDIADGLETQSSDLFLRKTATDSFHRTELHDLLQARGVTKLAICGLQSEFCVDTTTRRALAHGYPVTLVSDAHSTSDNGVRSFRTTAPTAPLP
jgi:nicotinamidase-related amidase